MTLHTEHTEACSDCWCENCRKFSTDGTRLGQMIAHVMGTTSDEVILRNAETKRIQENHGRMTGMEEEQADWDADE